MANSDRIPCAADLYSCGKLIASTSKTPESNEMSKFNPKAYWQERLSKNFDLSGVGDRTWTERYNRLLYRIRSQQFRRLLFRHFTKLDSVSAIDIGSGTGFYIDQLTELGLTKLRGADLTGAAVSRLSTSRPDIEFTEWDVTTPIPLQLAGQRFDLVTCIDVLFHIVDDDAYANAITNLSNLLNDGGALLLSENLGELRKERVHQVVRTENEILSLLRGRGLTIVTITPMFVLMNDPVRINNKLLRFIHTNIVRVCQRNDLLGRTMSQLAVALELLLVSTFTRGPSTEFIIAKKQRT